MGFAMQLRSRHPTLGYWVACDSAAVAERIARTGYDYVCLDMQHGLLDGAVLVHSLMGVDAGGCAGVVRVSVNEGEIIGRALDAGARGVIVPLIDSAEDAAEAVAACRYPPVGRRSYGPVRSGLRIGPSPREADNEVACIVMIETRAGLEDVEAICATPGVDGVYIGPNDLSLALGANSPAERDRPPSFKPALERTLSAAKSAGVAVGIHCNSGLEAAVAFAGGFTFASISCDLDHLEAYAAQQCDQARSEPAGTQ